jgi:hypothetical protein
MSNLPPVNPVNSAFIDAKKRHQYLCECMDVRCNIERCVNTHHGVKTELAKLEVVIGYDAKWLMSMYKIMCHNIHHSWDIQGNAEWIKEVDTAVEGILEKLRR